jgi:polar amino acid transport system substrate-binding protein
MNDLVVSQCRRITCMVWCVLGLACGPAAAGPVDCGNRPITVAFFDFGLFYYETNGKAQGIDKDLVDELSKRTGCAFSVVVMPRARIFGEISSGTLDMTVTAIQTPERDQYAWFAPYAQAKNYAIVTKRIAAIIRNPEDFLGQDGLQFGVVRSFKHGQDQDSWLEKVRQRKRVVENASVDRLFDGLDRGLFDAVFSQPQIFRKFISELNSQDRFVVQDWYPRDKGVVGGLMLAKSRFSELEAGKWQTLIHTMKTDGTLERIFKRYVSASEAKAMLVN